MMKTMTTKTTIKKPVLLALMATGMAMSLASCSGNNPLKSQDSNDAARFLVSASQHAEVKMGLTTDLGGYYYEECIEGKRSEKLCNKLYQNMVVYAKTTQAFKSLTVSDLEDKAVFKKLKDDYDFHKGAVM